MKGILSTGEQIMKLSKKKYRDLPVRGSGDSTTCRKRGLSPRYAASDGWKRYPAKDKTVQFFIIWVLFLAIIVFGTLSSINQDKEDDEPAPIKETIRKFFY